MRLNIIHTHTSIHTYVVRTHSRARVNIKIILMYGGNNKRWSKKLTNDIKFENRKKKETNKTRVLIIIKSDTTYLCIVLTKYLQVMYNNARVHILHPRVHKMLLRRCRSWTRGEKWTLSEREREPQDTGSEKQIFISVYERIIDG